MNRIEDCINRAIAAVNQQVETSGYKMIDHTHAICIIENAFSDLAFSSGIDENILNLKSRYDRLKEELKFLEKSDFDRDNMFNESITILQRVLREYEEFLIPFLNKIDGANK